MWWLPPLRWVLYPAGAASVLWLHGATTRRNTGSVLSGKKRRQSLLSKRPSVSERAPPQASHPSEISACRAFCRADGPGRGVESRRPRGRVVKATTTPPSNSNPIPTPQLVTEVPRQPKVTATRQTAGPKKPEPKPTAATKPSAGKSRKKAAAGVITAAAKFPTSTWWAPPKAPPPHSRVDLISSFASPSKHVWNGLVGF